MTCAVDACDRRRKARGWCNAHYERWRRNGDVDADTPIGPCSPRPDSCTAGPCTRPVRAKGLCTTHLWRLEHNGDPQPDRPIGRQGGLPVGATRTTVDGYVWEKIAPTDPHIDMARKDGWISQHRYRMAKSLGRNLKSWEQVHHKDGRRDSNELDNLELWVRSQPAGQRAADLQQCRVDGCERSVGAYDHHLCRSCYDRAMEWLNGASEGP